MTLQKIADAVGVSYGTVHSVASDLIINSDIENERGQMRPMHYASRDVELFNSDKLPGDDGKYRPMHYAARARRDALSECRPQPPGRALRCDCLCFRLVARLFPRRTAYSGLPLNGPVCVCAAPSTLATRARNSASSARNSAMSASPASVVAIAVWVIC